MYIELEKYRGFGVVNVKGANKVRCIQRREVRKERYEKRYEKGIFEVLR